MSEEKKVKFRVVGMHCATCVSTVSKALSAAGASQASVDLATGNAEAYGKIRPSAIYLAVRKAGYDVDTKEVIISVNIEPDEGRRLENALSEDPDVFYYSYNPASRIARVKVNSLSDPDGLVDRLRKSGFDVKLMEGINRSPAEAEFRSLVLSLVTAIAFVPFVLFFQYSGRPVLAFLLSMPIQFYSGLRYYRGAFMALKNRTTNMDVLVSLSAGTAWAYSVYGVFTGGTVFFDAASLLITFVLLGKVIEAYLRGKISAFKAPRWTARLEDGAVVDSWSLVPGQAIVVKAGEVVPADGVVIDGSGEVDESILTGESRPVRKAASDPVVAGSTLISGFIKVHVTRAGEDTYFSQIAREVSEMTVSPYGMQRLADRAASYFTPAVILIALVAFAYWARLGVGIAILFAISVLAAACPCALGLATPIAVLVKVKRLAIKGIVVRKGDALEKVKDVKTIIFDKTGTLTTGELVARPVFLGDAGLLKHVKAVESMSPHPVARAIVNAMPSDKTPQVSEFYELPGEGVYGISEGHVVIVGTRDLAAKNCKSLPEGDVIALVDGVPVASFIIQDKVREGARELIEWFKKDYEVIIATGDPSQFSDEVGRELGVKVIKGLDPHEKAKLVRETEKCMFVGDGVNDALAIKEAFVGVSLSSGAELTKQAGDIVINVPDALRTVINESKTLEGRIKENIAWAFGYNAVFLALAGGVLYPSFILMPQYAALAMSMNSVVVSLWSFIRG